jgi:Tfp pilus assembly protein FimT
MISASTRKPKRSLTIGNCLVVTAILGVVGAIALPNMI